jgi:hypothetical protein
LKTLYIVNASGSTLSFLRRFLEICRANESELVYFDARCFCLSAVENVPPASGKPAGGTISAAGKKKVKSYYSLPILRDVRKLKD